MTDFAPCSGPVARREFLRLGALGLGGMTLPELFRRRELMAAATGQSSSLPPSTPAKSCICSAALTTTPP